MTEKSLVVYQQFENIYLEGEPYMGNTNCLRTPIATKMSDSAPVRGNQPCLYNFDLFYRKSYLEGLKLSFVSFTLEEQSVFDFPLTLIKSVC